MVGLLFISSILVGFVRVFFLFSVYDFFKGSGERREWDLENIKDIIERKRNMGIF